MRPAIPAVLAALVAAIVAGCGGGKPQAPAAAYSPVAQAPAAPPAVTLNVSCVVGWSIEDNGTDWSARAPGIPGGVPFSQLQASDYMTDPGNGDVYNGDPWDYPSWSAFLATMEETRVTLSNPAGGAMTPTASAVVVFYDAAGAELQSVTEPIGDTELMPGQSSSVLDPAPDNTASCQVVSWSA